MTSPNKVKATFTVEDQKLKEVRELLSRANHQYYEIVQALSDASRNGYLEVIKLLTKKGFSEKNNVLDAAENGHLNIVRFLVEGGSSLDLDSCSPFLYAAMNGHLDVVRYLVSQGVNVNSDDGLALRWASDNGHLDVVKFLIKNGLNDRTAWNHSLRKSVRNNHVGVAKFLIDQGCNPLEYEYKNETPLTSARLYGRFDITSYFMSLSLLNDADRRCLSPKKYELEYGGNHEMQRTSHER